MARNGYTTIIVEIYEAERTGGKHGRFHVRPAKDQPFAQSLDVECNSSLVERHRPGTLLRMDVKKKFRNGGGEHLYSFYKWEPEVIYEPPISK